MHDDMCEQDVPGTSVSNDLFRPGKWLFAVSFINRLIASTNVLIAVLAEPQGGKTSCISMLREGLEPGIAYALLKANVYLTSAHAIKHLADSLDIPWTRSLLLSTLIDHINEKKEPFLFLIDDAHFVPYTLLQDMLQEIQRHGENNYFHVCLFSDFTITPRLQSLNARRFNNLIYSMELGALSESETKAYVLQTLKPAHPLAAVPTEEKLQAFFKQNAGSMAKINQDREIFFHVRIGPIRHFIWAMQQRYHGLKQALHHGLSAIRLVITSAVKQFVLAVRNGILSMIRIVQHAASGIQATCRRMLDAVVSACKQALSSCKKCIVAMNNAVKWMYTTSRDKINAARKAVSFGITSVLQSIRRAVMLLFLRSLRSVRGVASTLIIHTRIPSPEGLTGRVPAAANMPQAVHRRALNDITVRSWVQKQVNSIREHITIHTRIPSPDGLTGRIPASAPPIAAIESQNAQAVYHRSLDGITASLDKAQNRVKLALSWIKQHARGIKAHATIHTRIPSANGLRGQSWALFCGDDPDAKPVKPKRNKQLLLLSRHGQQAWSRIQSFGQSVRIFFTWDVKAIFFGESSQVPKKRTHPYVLRNMPLALAVVGAVFLSAGLWQNLNMPDMEPMPSMETPVHTPRSLPVMAKAQVPAPVLTSKVPALTVAAVRMPMQSVPRRLVIEEEDDSLEKLVVRDSVLVIPKPMPALAYTPNELVKAVAEKQNPLPGKRIALATAKDRGQHHFTIQLLASVSDHDLRRFIIKQHLVGKVRTRSILKDGVKWYVLTMGNYGRKDQAQRVIRQLSPQLVKLHPWVRAIDEFSAVG